MPAKRRRDDETVGWVAVKVLKQFRAHGNFSIDGNLYQTLSQ